MKLRGLFIAVAVLAALTGLLYWSNHHKPGEESSVKAALNSAPKILSLNQPDIAQISIQHFAQQPIELVKDQSGTWQITQPIPLAANQEAVSTLLSSLSSLDSDRLIEDKVSDLAQYGLDSPRLALNVKLKNKQSQKLLIGDRTPTGNSYYAMLAGDPRLFTLATYNESSLDKSANDLRDKRLITADFDKVSQIDLSNLSPGKKMDIAFARNKNAWQILKPQAYRTDNSLVEDLVRSLKDAQIELNGSSDAKKDLSVFQSAAPFARVKVVGASGTQDLQLRKVKGDYYAKSSVLSGAYKVSSSVAKSLDKTADDFRDKKLFDFGYADPDKVEIHVGEKAYYITHAGSDWWSADGKKWDSSLVESVLDKLRDLSATAFPSAGFSNPSLRISVLSNDKKRTEAVEFTKGKDNYIAKRDGESDLYAIPDSSITELEKSAAALKPAAPPAPSGKK